MKLENETGRSEIGKLLSFAFSHSALSAFLGLWRLVLATPLIRKVQLYNQSASRFSEGRNETSATLIHVSCTGFCPPEF